MIKFLQVAHFISPGLSYQENIYCSELSKYSELDNYIISASKNYPKSMGYANLQKMFPSRDIIPGCYYEEKVKSIRLYPTIEIGFKLWLKELISSIKIIQPDIILVHGVTNLSTLRIALYKLLFRKKFKLLVDDHSIKTLSSSWYNKIFKLLFSQIVNTAVDCYLPISEETMSIIRNNYGCNGNFKILRLGANDKVFFQDFNKRNAFRKKYNIKDKENVFLFTGKINSSKGVDIIIKAFAQICEQFPLSSLFLVGVYDDTYMENLKKLIDTLNISKKIYIHNNVSTIDLANYFNGADIGLWPFSETISVIEAQLCGLPVIVNASEISKDRINYTSKNPSGYIVTLEKEQQENDLYTQMLSFCKNTDKTTMQKNALLNSKKYKNSEIIKELISIIKYHYDKTK